MHGLCFTELVFTVTQAYFLEMIKAIFNDFLAAESFRINIGVLIAHMLLAQNERNGERGVAAANAKCAK